jgi:hypothetical protein
MGRRISPLLILTSLLTSCTSPTVSKTSANGHLAGSTSIPLPKHVAAGLKPAMDLLQSPVEVESYRIEPKAESDLSKDVLGYPMITRGLSLDVPTRQ